MAASHISQFAGAISAALDRGALVIASGHRAAAELRHSFAEQQKRAALQRWRPPSIHTWTSWLQEMSRDLILGGQSTAIPLNADQEHLLWSEVIQADAAAASLPRSSGLAMLAQTAWHRLASYDTDLHHPERESRTRFGRYLSQSADTDAFARWCAAFDNLCRRLDLLSAPLLPGRVANALHSNHLHLSHTEVLLVGFDEFTPAQRLLLEAVQRAGATVSSVVTRDQTRIAHVAKAADEDSELTACARWCIARSQAGNRVAIVVPELEADRAALGRALREELLLRGEGSAFFTSETQPFAFSSTGFLVHEPMVIAALDLLQLASESLPLERAGRLIRSRYFGASPHSAEIALDTEPTLEDEVVAGQDPFAADHTEWAARAEFEAFDLRDPVRLRPEVSLSDLLRAVTHSKRASRLPQLARALARLRHHASARVKGRHSYGHWAEVFRRLVTVSGWASLRGAVQTEAELTVSGLWDSALDALATLSFRGGRVSVAEARQALIHILRHRAVPSVAGDAPLQVLSAGEAAGCEFDALWCLRTGESSWPAGATSLALLPWSLQRDLGMPGTDRAREAERSAEAMKRLCATAPEVVFSYASTTSKGEQRAAAGVRALSLPEQPATELAGTPRERVITGLESILDISPIEPLPDRVFRQGAAILSAQAACGFRAFAENRLASSPLRRAALGLDRREVGNAVHKALDQLWGELGSRSNALEMTVADRDALVDHAVAQGLRIASAAQGEPWSAAYLSLQQRRLRRLLKRWLAIELERPDFTVESRETSIRDARIGPLRLSLRIDRIDVVDGTRVLIDYKTGAASTNDWQGERPDAPQVPLYAILAASSSGDPLATGPSLPLGALAFAKVHGGKDAKFEGIAARPGLLPRRTGRQASASEDLPAHLQQWQSVLEKLASGFAAGDATVQPKSFPQTCEYCQQRLLCRLDASALKDEDDDFHDTGDNLDG